MCIIADISKIYREKEHSEVLRLLQETREEMEGREGDERGADTVQHKEKEGEDNSENPKKICWKCHKTDETSALSKCRGCKKVFLLVLLLYWCNLCRHVTAAISASKLTGPGMGATAGSRWRAGGTKRRIHEQGVILIFA